MFANLRTLFLLSTTAKLIHPTPKKKLGDEINRFPIYGEKTQKRGGYCYPPFF